VSTNSEEACFAEVAFGGFKAVARFMFFNLAYKGSGSLCAQDSGERKTAPRGRRSENLV
jgi:hypothetical protein